MAAPRGPPIVGSRGDRDGTPGADRLLFPANLPSLDVLDPGLLRDLVVGDTIPDGPPGTAWYVVEEAGPDVGEPRFGTGDRVRVRDWHPAGHTRCPGYVRGKTGTVVRLDGNYSVPDIEAHGTARRYEPTYSVRFAAADLWQDGQHGVSVHADLWDSYLEPA
jgi:Nitrile hydratase beta subunit, C-terminal